jgi:hypothetical protein
MLYKKIGSSVIPMTNGDIIRLCNNEQLLEVRNNLDTYAIYANNRLVINEYDEDFLLWLNKATDDIDLETIFPFINKEDYEHPYLRTNKTT